MRKEWKDKKEAFENKYKYEEKLIKIQQKLKEEGESVVEKRKKKVKIDNKEEIQTILRIPNLSNTLGQEDDIQEKLFKEVFDAKEQFKKNKEQQDAVKLSLKYFGKVGRKKKEKEENITKP